MGVENNENTLRTLSYAKEKYNLSPKIVTSDFSQNLIGPICEVFGEEVLQIDGFHVMQELNKGIKRDILDYKNKHFRKRISEFISLRSLVNKMQEEFISKNICSKLTINKSITINSKNKDAKRCLKLIMNIKPIINQNDPHEFIKLLEKLLTKYERQDSAEFNYFVLKIREKLPKSRMTVKTIVRIKNELLKKLKTLFLQFRSKLESESKIFFKNHWLIFVQPERMTEERKSVLRNFLEKNPSLKEYREMTLQVGGIYRKSIEEITGNEIDGLITKEYYSDKLKTAIKTFKKFKKAILRFTQVFKTDPSLAKSCRANMEYFNLRFKEPFKHGNNLTSKKHLIAKLTLQLKCEIRFFIEKIINKKRYKKLNV